MLMRQVIVDEHSSKLQKKATDISIQGCMDKNMDIYAMNGNFYELLEFAAEDIKLYPPMMATCLNNYTNIFNSTEEGREIANTMDGNIPFMHSVVTEMIHIFNQFSMLTVNTEAREQVKAKASLDVQMFKDALTNAQHIQRRLQNAVMLGDARKFLHEPVTLSAFYPASVLFKNSSMSSYGIEAAKVSSKSAAAGAPTAKKQKVGEATTAKGFLTYSGSGPMPTPDNISMKHPKTGKPMPLCRDFMYQDHVCTRGSACKFIHIRSLRDIDREKQQHYTQCVKATPGVEFAYGPPRANTPGQANGPPTAAAPTGPPAPPATAPTAGG